jgi:hypothetical protein
MFKELSVLEESVKEVLVDLGTEKIMSERRMSAGVQASSIGGVQASPLTSRGAGTSRITTETKMKHIDDIANANMILSILPAYLPPISDAINRDNVPKDGDYALVVVYLPKGIRGV